MATLPNWLQTWTKGSTARLRWTEVAPGIEYHVVVERQDVTNTYVPAGDLFVTNQTWTELTLSEGRHRARIQTRSCGRFMGPWSEELQFSVEGEPSNDSSEAPSQSGESAEGQRAFPGQSLTDSTGAVWTLGAQGQPGTYQVLRNGVIDQGTFASQLKYHNHTVYLFAHDGNWYQYLGGGNWASVGPGEP